MHIHDCNGLHSKKDRKKCKKHFKKHNKAHKKHKKAHKKKYRAEGGDNWGQEKAEWEATNAAAPAA